MFLVGLDPRRAALIRGPALALVVWSVFSATHGPGTSGRGLVVTLSLAVATAAWLSRMIRPSRAGGLLPEMYALGIGGGVLTGASPESAASVFVFVAVAGAFLRTELRAAASVYAVGTLAVAAAFAGYGGSALGALAYSLGFAATAFAGANARGTVVRAEQAELLLAQTQRSHEEQLRSARLEEQARIAREIHDVLAHTLAGLSIQLEATAAVVAGGAPREEVLARVHRAHALAREGLIETRRAVGALRGEPAPGLEELVAEFRAGWPAPVTLDLGVRPGGASGEAVHRVVQEALTNVGKHAPGSEVAVSVHAGPQAGGELVAVVLDRPCAGGVGGARPLAQTGGGYGLRGMRERAELLGGTLTAGPAEGGGWRVELRLPVGSPVVQEVAV